MKKIMVFIATGAYVGKIPFMPGTFGTLWGVFFAWLASWLSIESQALITLAVIATSIFVSGQASRALGGKDHPSIIADEISGYLVGIFLIPFTPFNAILVFILFRFFDILKPYPAGLLDRRLGGGAGIVLDDLVAGVYANISAHAVLWLI
ncbi:MAG: phosphatidylglycerophosphatase A [Deltaproteobacteria bacterium]|nr:phosphatidylglycerophosphatase A [Deltaproteobacteria bacterium]MBZ0218867.1 phosphatidylglycerophosphatase A [Deltaproteobacteria bacterium]